MLKIILLYLPSLIGLALVNVQLYQLLKIARERDSIATPFVSAITLAMVGVIASWFVVVKIALEFSTFGFPVIDWRISFLPIGWAGILVFINNWLRK